MQCVTVVLINDVTLKVFSFFSDRHGHRIGLERTERKLVDRLPKDQAARCNAIALRESVIGRRDENPAEQLDVRAGAEYAARRIRESLRLQREGGYRPKLCVHFPVPHVCLGTANELESIVSEIIPHVDVILSILVAALSEIGLRLCP